MNRFVVTFLLLVISPGAVAGQEKSLSGRYQLSGKTVIDPPADEPADTHFRIALEGAAAQDLYRSMKVAAKPNECGTGGPS